MQTKADEHAPTIICLPFSFLLVVKVKIEVVVVAEISASLEEKNPAVDCCVNHHPKELFKLFLWRVGESGSWGVELGSRVGESGRRVGE